MAALVKCRVCGRRISEEAAREVKGAICCPPCYEELAARLKAEKDSPPPTPPSPPRRPSGRTGAPQATAGPAPLGPLIGRRPLSPSEKLARKVLSTAGARQTSAGHGASGAPARPAARARGLPDIPPEFRNAAPVEGRDSAAGGRFQVSRLGLGIVFAVIGLGLYGAYLWLAGKAKGEADPSALVPLGLAAGAGLAAVLVGAFNVWKGGETLKQVFGALAVAAGLFLAGYGGPKFISECKSKAPAIMEGDAGGKRIPPGPPKKDAPARPGS